MTLREDVENFILHGTGPRELESLLSRCFEDGSLEGLLCTSRLFEDMYGGITFNVELKAPAGWELACWGERGLDQITSVASRMPTSKNRSLCVEILSAIASGGKLVDLKPLLCDQGRAERIDAVVREKPELVAHARKKLTEFVLSIEEEGDFLSTIGLHLLGGATRSGDIRPAKELFAAISKRLLAVSQPVLEQYNKLIVNQSNNEPAFQEFLAHHPQILDPMAAEVWPQPNLHGSQIPDFVIRRFDNSYVVVEIETPGKQLITEGNQLSALATHAVAQATEYRRFLERLPAVQTHFPGLDEVSCLVVIGLDGALTPAQAQALRNDNRQRHGLQVVGFDWLARRSAAVRDNIIRTDVEVRGIRVT